MIVEIDSVVVVMLSRNWCPAHQLFGCARFSLVFDDQFGGVTLVILFGIPVPLL